MLALGIALAATTIATPYRNGAWLDPATTVIILGVSLNLGYGPAMAILYLAKLRVVAVVADTWRRSRLVGQACACVAMMLVAVSIFNTWKVLERQRSARVEQARADVLRANAIDEELRAVRARLALLAWRPLESVEADIAAERLSWIWDTTAGCTKLESGTHRKFCQNMLRLEGARTQAAQAESLRQREAELAGARLAGPVVAYSPQANDGDLLQAILIAVAIEITEVVLFGLAGFLAPSSAPLGMPGACGQGPVDPAPRSASGGLPPARQGSPEMRAPGAAEPIATAASDGHDETLWRTTSLSPPPDEPGGLGRNAEERRREVEAVVASLRREPNLRTSGSAIYDFYTKMCEERGWPPMARNVFGQLLKRAVEAMGGRKTKASRQFYEGVGLP